MKMVKLGYCKGQKSPIQDYVNENILSALDAQKVANLICQQMTLVSLVKDMRKAQEDVCSFLDFSEVPEFYFDKMSKLEEKVDNLLKNMEEKEWAEEEGEPEQGDR